MADNEQNTRTFEGQYTVRKAIEKYLSKHGMTSLRRIAAYVEKETGLRTSASTVGRIVHKFGYTRQVVEWQKVEEVEMWVKE